MRVRRRQDGRTGQVQVDRRSRGGQVRGAAEGRESHLLWRHNTDGMPREGGKEEGRDGGTEGGRAGGREGGREKRRAGGLPRDAFVPGKREVPGPYSLGPVFCKAVLKDPHFF